MKNGLADLRQLDHLKASQRGVFSLDDLQSALAEKHRAALYRRIARWVDLGYLRRFTRGIYVTEGFDLATLSQRIAPDSAISFETVLARHLVIGPNPVNRVSALSGRRSRTYSACGVTVEYHHATAAARFAEEVREGLRFTEPEKAMLDVLYFHLRGRKALFDIYGDVNLNRLNSKKLSELLGNYRNPKFVAFAREVLQLS